MMFQVFAFDTSGYEKRGCVIIAARNNDDAVAIWKESGNTDSLIQPWTGDLNSGQMLDATSPTRGILHNYYRYTD